MNALRRAIIVVSVLLLAGLSLAATSRSAPQQKAVREERMACPSTDFATFFHDFSEKAEVQRAFTRFPLAYGLLDLLSPGYPFVEEKISSYDKIPTLNHDNGLIFPDEKERPGTDLRFAMMEGQLRFTAKDGFIRDFKKVPESAVGRTSDIVTVMLYIEESGFQVFYRFKKERNCWFLVRIDDKST